MSDRFAGIPTSPGVVVGAVAHSGAGLPATQADQPHAILIVSDLEPADVLSLDPQAVVGVATAHGAPLSHAAILLRSLGIPAVTGLGPGVLHVPAGILVLVDGDTGTLILGPTPGEVEAADSRRRDARAREDEDRRTASAPALTRDGAAVSVLANVGGSGEAALAVREGADGVGMLRTEFAFLGRDEPPSEQEQYEAYRAVADAVGHRPLVVRTLDLGADIPAWRAPPEPNPALGNRGIRFTLGWPELFATQLRAVARLAAERPLRLMFPMVTTVDELRRAMACLGGVEGVEVGITVEVPAAALTADRFAPMVDFFAIGTNDLTQYTLAADRANPAVAHIADGLHPAVLRLVRAVTAAGARHGREVEVVGELASDRCGLPILLGLGVTTLSVRPNAVAGVKRLVRAIAIEDAGNLAAAGLEAESAEAVRALVARHWASTLTS